MGTPIWAEKLIQAGSALNTVGVLNKVTGSKATGTVVYVTFGAGTTGGTVLIEGAADPAYPGTWATLATINWVAANRVHETFISGAFLGRRVRISSAILTGTVDVDALVVG